MLVKTDFGKIITSTQNTDKDIMWFKLSCDMSDIHIMLYNSRNSRQSEFIVNNNKLTDPGDIANAFNDYFINIGRQLSDKMQSPHHYSDYLHNQVESHLQLKPISEIDISTIINNLKNKASYGHDEISNKLSGQDQL